MYGKIFASMFEGSMIKSGAVVFAVWAYVIAKMQPDKTVGMQVDINPETLAFALGESVEAVNKAIEYLCAPDPKSRSKEAEGRRLVKLGEYTYRVVNGAKYRDIRNEEARRESNRRASSKYRIKKVSTTAQMIRAVNADTPEEAAKIASEGL